MGPTVNNGHFQKPSNFLGQTMLPVWTRQDILSKRHQAKWTFSRSHPLDEARYFVTDTIDGEAVARGDAAAVEQLLERGADVNTRVQSGGTLLTLAARKQSAEVVQLLLDHGADACRKTSGGNTAMDLARSPDVLRVLQQHGRAERGGDEEAGGDAGQPAANEEGDQLDEQGGADHGRQDEYHDRDREDDEAAEQPVAAAARRRGVPAAAPGQAGEAVAAARQPVAFPPEWWHFPVVLAKTGDCHLCSCRGAGPSRRCTTRVQCETCRVYLCVKPPGRKRAGPDEPPVVFYGVDSCYKIWHLSRDPTGHPRAGGVADEAHNFKRSRADFDRGSDPDDYTAKRQTLKRRRRRGRRGSR